MNRTSERREPQTHAARQSVVERCACGCRTPYIKGNGIRDTVSQKWYAEPWHRSEHQMKLRVRRKARNAK